MLYGLLFTLPTPAELTSNIGSTTAVVLPDFFPIIYYVGGIILVAAIVWLVVSLISHGASTFRR